MSNDLISREALKKEISKRISQKIKWTMEPDVYSFRVDEIVKMIDNAPTVELKQGEWKVDGALIACNKCGRILLKASELYNFCPNCGAKMRGTEHDVSKRLQ